MAKLIGISGSLRRASLNTALLRAAQELVPDGSELTIESIEGIPLYNADEEAEHGVPEVVSRLKDAIADADGLLIATPEYNNSMPGVLKNAIDYLSRPADDIARVFGGRAVAVMGASPGGFGTLLAQTAWLPIWRMFHVRPYFERSLYVSRAHQHFEDGALTDEDTKQRLAAFLEGFCAFAGR